MDKKEIFIKAVDQAIENGYEKDQAEAFRRACENVFGNPFENITFVVLEPLIIAFLTDHRFAKAFWGTDGVETEERWSTKKMYKWQLRLQEMVLEDDYISYIKVFLKKQL